MHLDMLKRPIAIGDTILTKSYGQYARTLKRFPSKYIVINERLAHNQATWSEKYL